MSPNFPRDGSYFPSGDHTAQNGHPHPFRYSKEAMLALWSEEKVKERPIELADLGAGAEVMVSKGLVKPVGLRELSDAEKKVRAIKSRFGQALTLVSLASRYFCSSAKPYSSSAWDRAPDQYLSNPSSGRSTRFAGHWYCAKRGHRWFR